MESNYNDYDAWPTMDVRIPTAGGRLMTKHGNICAYMDADGQVCVLPGMQVSDAASWEAFGINDPVEQAHMEQKLAALIHGLTGARYE